jgi:hypothetical protein
MKTVIFVFCLSLLPIAFAYSQSEADAHCNLNLENIFKVHTLKIKYETVQYIYKERKSRFPKNSDFLNGYFELIRGFPLSSKKQCDSVSGVNPGELAKVEWMSEREMDSYIEQLNCTPEKALNEYRDFIRNIKSEKEIYFKCIDAELAKGGLSEYAGAEMPLYGFMPPGWSLTPPPTRLSKLDFLKVFKEFIFNNDEDVLPEGARVVSYLSGFADADIVALSQKDLRQTQSSAKSQKALSHDNLVALSQKSVVNAVNILYREIKDFDRECFLLGTMDDYYRGHDRIATYETLLDGMWDMDIALLVVDCEKPSISSGDSIGYKGVINKEKISTQAQKRSFLAGVLFRYGGFFKNTAGNYSVIIPNSLSTAKECMDILNEFGCKVKKNPEEHKIIFSVSDKIANLTHLLYGLFIKTSAGIIAF